MGVEAMTRLGDTFPKSARNPENRGTPWALLDQRRSSTPPLDRCPPGRNLHVSGHAICVAKYRGSFPPRFQGDAEATIGFSIASSLGVQGFKEVCDQILIMTKVVLSFLGLAQGQGAELACQESL